MTDDTGAASSMDGTAPDADTGIPTNVYAAPQTQTPTPDNPQNTAEPAPAPDRAGGQPEAGDQTPTWTATVRGRAQPPGLGQVASIAAAAAARGTRRARSAGPSGATAEGYFSEVLNALPARAVEPALPPVPDDSFSTPKTPTKFDISSPLGDMNKESKEADRWASVVSMMEKMVESMQKQISELQQKLDHQQDTRKGHDRDGIPYVNSKDVERPTKYDGTQFRLWHQNFVAFLEAKDERFELMLAAIKSMSTTPLTPEKELTISRSAKLHDATLVKAFKSQLFRYLQSYTKGESHTVVLAGGQEGVWESMRQLCDAGNSQQRYCQREERRKVWHPKQLSLDDLKVGIATWENNLEEYVRNTGEKMDLKTKTSCLEDLCPVELQEHLAEKADMPQGIDSYDDYKQAINNYLHKKIRFARPKNQKLNALNTESDEAAGDEAESHEPEEEWKDVEKLWAMVKGKFGKKGKGKGKGDKGAAAMDVDKPVCHECGNEDHFVRDCPIRAAKNLAKGKTGGKGVPWSQGDKGKGDKGKGKGGKGVPNLTTWNSYYPGPSPTMWKNWYPYGQQQNQINGKVNLFEQPYQMNILQPSPTPQDALQGLFNTTGNFFKFVEKGPKAKTVPKVQHDFFSKNIFDELATEDDNVAEDHSHPPPPHTSAEHANRSKKSEPHQARRSCRLECSATCCTSSGTTRSASSSATSSATACQDMPPRPLPVTSGARSKPQLTTCVNLTDALKKPSQNAARKLRIKEMKAKEVADNLDFFNAVNDFIKTDKEGKATPEVLNVFRSKPANPTLCPFKKPRMDVAPTDDPRTWEIMSAVVDSGASIAALTPEDGKGYPVEESAASKAGVEYEVANKDTVPALGQKKLAVITPEGSLRGYRSEVADVSGPLQSVRQLLGAKHCVLFGLGPNEEEHLIINKLTGEINRMRDDGTNYLQDLLVVPPDQLDKVVARMQGGDPAAPFGRQG